MPVDCVKESLSVDGRIICVISFLAYGMKMFVLQTSVLGVIYLITGLSCVQSAVADSSDLKSLIQNGDEVSDRELMAALLNRVIHLESQDKHHQLSVQTLQSTIRRQNRRITVLEGVVKDITSSKSDGVNAELNSNIVEKEVEQYSDQDVHGAINGTQQARHARDVSRSRRQLYNAVAFYATIDNHHLKNLGADQDIPFDKVYTNVGNAYHPNLGVFIAPEPGTYVFSVTMMDVNNHDTRYYFSVNSTGKGNLFIHGLSAYLASTSKTVTLLLRQNDEVSVRNANVNEGVYGYDYSSFTGFLISYDDSPGVVVG